MSRKQLVPTEEQLAIIRAMNIRQASQELNLSRQVVRRWVRQHVEREPHPRGRPCRGLPEGLIEELGTAPDTALAKRHRVPASTVRNHRRRNGIPAFDPEAIPQGHDETRQLAA